MMTCSTPSDLPVPPDIPGIVLCPGQWTTESGELAHAPTAPNIALATPSMAGALPTATAVDPPQRNVEDNGFIDSPPCDDEDDGFVVALAATGMQMAPPHGAVVVEGTPTWTSARYEAAFGGLTQLVLSGEAGDEDSQPLLSPPTDTDPPFPPLPPQQWGAGNGYCHLHNDCNVLHDKCEEDRVSIVACFDKLFEQHTKIMDRLFKRMMEEKDATRQAQIQASFGKIVKLEKELRSAPNAVTTHLDAVVPPQAIATVLDWTLPSMLAMALQEMISPTLKMVLDNAISDTFVLVMDGTFLVFQLRLN
jgi:hypothetical protein